MKSIATFILLFVLLLLPMMAFSQTELMTVPYRKGSKWGIVKMASKIPLLKTKYDSIGPFNQLVTWVKKGKRYGYVDRNGNRVTKLKYRKIDYKDWEEARKKHYEKYYWYYGWEKNPAQRFGRCGGVISSFLYFNTYKMNGLVGIILCTSDKEQYKGEIAFLDSIPMALNSTMHKDFVALAPTFEELRENLQGFAIVKVDGKWCMIDKYGNYINDKLYDFLEINTSSSGQDRAPIKFQLNGKWGFLRYDGTVIVPAKYDQVDFFREGIAKVYYGQNKMGFIDMAGIEYFED